MIPDPSIVQVVEGVRRGTADRGELARAIRSAVEALDRAAAGQLAAVVRHPSFQALDRSWRGLHNLVMNTETARNVKVKVLNVSKAELHADLTGAVSFNESQAFEKVYRNEFCFPAGEPFGVLIGDYEFGPARADADFLGRMSCVADAAFCPFIAAAAPRMFGVESWDELSQRQGLEPFQADEYLPWRSIRDSHNSAFIVLVVPCEVRQAVERPNPPAPAGGRPGFNGAYVLARVLANAFASDGWWTGIRGVVTDGAMERRANEFSNLGFLPLYLPEGGEYTAIGGTLTTQKPKKYDRPEATANARVAAGLPYVLGVARFAHYFKVLARDKIGSFMEASHCEAWLNRWLQQYINPGRDLDSDAAARWPLAEGRVEIKEIPGRPGVYTVAAYLRPWVPPEELTTVLRTVVRIPSMCGFEE